jgi:predicted nucleic acid-binding protein
VIFCDSSFLVALYLGTQSFSETAREIATAFDRGIPYPWLIELELCTALRRVLASKRELLKAALRVINSARKEGLLVECELDYERLVSRALELSERYASALGLRTLDILHVAAALELQADALASFDNRQRALAKELGLEVLPNALPSASR